MIGVNKFTAAAEEPQRPLQVDLAIEREQAELLAKLRSSRSAAGHKRRLDDLGARPRDAERAGAAARGPAARATVGEVCDALREVWGVYQPPDAN